MKKILKIGLIAAVVAGAGALIAKCVGKKVQECGEECCECGCDCSEFGTSCECHKESVTSEELFQEQEETHAEETQETVVEEKSEPTVDAQ